MEERVFWFLLSFLFRCRASSFVRKFHWSCCNSCALDLKESHRVDQLGGAHLFYSLQVDDPYPHLAKCEGLERDELCFKDVSTPCSWLFTQTIKQMSNVENGSWSSHENIHVYTWKMFHINIKHPIRHDTFYHVAGQYFLNTWKIWLEHMNNISRNMKHFHVSFDLYVIEKTSIFAPNVEVCFFSTIVHCTLGKVS